VEAAIKSYKQALVLRADFPEATCNLLHTLQCVCDWDDRDNKFSEVEAVVRRQIKVIILLKAVNCHMYIGEIFLDCPMTSWMAL
jgi:hypothetical protein